MRRSDIAALVAAAAPIVSSRPRGAVAHFVLQAPPAGRSRTGRATRRRRRRAARPIRRSPAVPTSAVTARQARADDHGHARRGRRTTRVTTASCCRRPGRAASPPDPADDAAGHVQWPRDPGPARLPRAGGRHAAAHRPASTARSRFRSQLPDDVTCANCTLQVLEFMSGRRGRQRQLLLSPLRGHLDRGRGGADGGGAGGSDDRRAVAAARSASGRGSLGALFVLACSALRVRIARGAARCSARRR